MLDVPNLFSQLENTFPAEPVNNNQNPANWQALKRVVALSVQLGERAMAIRASGIEVQQKGDGTPVTNADIEINDIAVATLPMILDVPVVSEENLKTLDLAAIEPSQEWWLIDPIDGTASYKGGYDGFAICLSLIKDGRPVLGVIAAPAMDVVYFATLGYGSFKLSISTGVVSQNVAKVSSQDFRFGGYYNYNSTHEEYLRRFLAENHLSRSVVEPVSSAMKYCLVADGTLNMAGGWQAHDSWDISAADIIVHEAGGSFVNYLTYQRFEYDPVHSTAPAPMALVRS